MSDKFAGRVIYVEDEPLIAMATEDILFDLGFASVDTYHTFDNAMDALNGGEYDLAVMDMNLNGTLSLPLIEKLAGTKTAVVVTTGYNAVQDITGLEDLVTVRKPFDDRQLKDAIERAFD